MQSECEFDAGIGALVILKSRQFAAVSLNVIRKIIRQPLILLMAASCIVLTSLLPVVVMFDFGEEGRLVRDGALAFHFVFGLAIAAASAAVALYDEIRRGRASMVLCKPVGRPVFLLATWCGVVIVLLMFSLMVMTAGLLSVRMSAWPHVDWRVAGFLYGALSAAFAAAAAGNAWRGRPFVSRAFLFMVPALLAALLATLRLEHAAHAGAAMECPVHGAHSVSAGAGLQWRMVPAGVLITMALAVLASLAVAFSTRLPPAFTVACCAGLFFLGLISDYLLGEARTVSRLAALCYTALPQWQNFWMIDALSGEGVIPWSYVAGAGVYAGLYLAGVLCLAVASFRNVEIS